MSNISKFTIAAIKRTAQNVALTVAKKNKLKERIYELQAEYDALVEAQEQFEAPIRKLTGGYSSEDLVDRVIEDTGKTDKEGRPVKTTKYVLRYPDTVVPPVLEDNITGTQVDETEKAPEVEVNPEDAVEINPEVQSPLAPVSDMPFNA